MRWLALKTCLVTGTFRVLSATACRASLLLCVLATEWALAPAVAFAGLGPENVFVVVNRASWASQTVANYYVELRQIPTSNILYLDWTGGTNSVEVETFRQQILGPVMIQIERRGLADQIDAIVYSSDFPYQVDLTGDFSGQKLAPQYSPHASITSATYLWQLVIRKNPAILALHSNQYMRTAGARGVDPLSQGFRSWYGWGPKGELIEGGGIHYMLSTMLAVTSGRGNSVTEAIGYLRRAAKADGTRPKGTIYYCTTNQLRTEIRSRDFPAAIDDLTKLGVNAEIVNGNLPMGKANVAGLMAGLRDFSWPSTKSTILPGAICEHLTSFGGVMAESGSHTPLSEFLRYGAAGASGTVVEPTGIADKFPLPAIQVHYARGSAMAEAFYQSVFGPYQLLIVGDPLCQPWAKFPKVMVEGVKSGEVLSGTVNVKVSATVPDGKVDRFEMFVDGRRVARRPAGSGLPLETTAFTDGYHELRVVGIDASPIETQGRVILPIVINNAKQKVELTASAKEARWGESLKLSVAVPGLEGGMVVANGRVIGEFKGEQADVEVKPRQLGSGPVTLVALGVTKDKLARGSSSPVRLEIKPSVPLPSLEQPKQQQFIRGLRLKIARGEAVPVQETQAADWLIKAGVKPGDTFGIEGYFDVPPPARNTVAISAADVAAESVFQFQVRYTGELKVAVDKSLLHDGKDGKDQQIFLPVALAPGLHRVRITGRVGDDGKLQILYGGEGTRSIDGKRFRQLAGQ